MFIDVRDYMYSSAALLSEVGGGGRLQRWGGGGALSGVGGGTPLEVWGGGGLAVSKRVQNKHKLRTVDKKVKRSNNFFCVFSN